MTKKITINSVSAIKSGKNKYGKNWTLYKVVDKDGTEYTTFSNFFQKNIGKEVDIEFEEEIVIGKNGKEFVNRRIIERKENKYDVILKELKEIKETLSDVYFLLHSKEDEK